MTPCHAAQELPAVDYADEVRVPLAREVSLDDAARAFLGAPPAWARALMAVRDAAGALLGLKRGLAVDPGAPLEVGARRGPFRVLARHERELVLGQDDRHLDFRTGLQIAGRALVVCTHVRFHGRLGRAYFGVVRPFHARIVRAMARRAADALAR